MITALIIRVILSNLTMLLFLVIKLSFSFFCTLMLYVMCNVNTGGKRFWGGFVFGNTFVRCQIIWNTLLKCLPWTLADIWNVSCVPNLFYKMILFLYWFIFETIICDVTIICTWHRCSGLKSATFPSETYCDISIKFHIMEIFKVVNLFNNQQPWFF